MYYKKVFFLPIFVCFVSSLFAQEQAGHNIKDQQDMVLCFNNAESPMHVKVEFTVPQETVMALEPIMLENRLTKTLRDALLSNSFEDVTSVVCNRSEPLDINESRAALLLALAHKKSISVEALLACDVAVDETFVSYAVNMSDIESAVKIAQKCTYDLHQFGNNDGALSLPAQLVLLSIWIQKKACSLYEKSVATTVSMLQKIKMETPRYWSKMVNIITT